VNEWQKRYIPKGFLQTMVWPPVPCEKQVIVTNAFCTLLPFHFQQFLTHKKQKLAYSKWYRFRVITTLTLPNLKRALYNLNIFASKWWLI